MEGAQSWSDKLVGFVSDGAANMRGIRSGVATYLTAEVSSSMVSIHCVSHRLELAFKASVKDIDIYNKVSKLLLDLYLYYHNIGSNASY